MEGVKTSIDIFWLLRILKMKVCRWFVGHLCRLLYLPRSGHLASPFRGGGGKLVGYRWFASHKRGKREGKEGDQYRYTPASTRVGDA